MQQRSAYLRGPDSPGLLFYMLWPLSLMNYGPPVNSLSVNSKMLRPMATTNYTVNDLQAPTGCIQSKFLKSNQETLLIVSRLVTT